MRVLVTGGAGFIGSHVADAYVRSGGEVLVVDNLSNGVRANVPNAASFEAIDISDRPRLSRLLRAFRPEIVSHHAAQTDVAASVRDPASCFRANVEGSFNLLASSTQANVRGFVFASSGGGIYGDTLDPATEQARKVPQSPYGAGKLAIEAHLLAFEHMGGLPACALRYANVYGPRQGSCGEGGVVSIFLQRMLNRQPTWIFGDGYQTRDFVHVRDVVAANMAVTHLLLSKSTPSCDVDDLAYNVGTSVATSIRALAASLRRLTGDNQSPCHKPARPGDIKHSVLSYEKAARHLAFKPEISLEQGLLDTVSWFRNGAARD